MAGYLGGAGCPGRADQDPERYDPIYIDSFDDRTYQGSVTVREVAGPGWLPIDVGDDEMIHDAEYEVPPETGLEIPEIVAEGRAYVIRTEFVNEVVEFSWDVRSCPQGSSDLVVGIHDSTLDLSFTPCDLAWEGVADVCERCGAERPVIAPPRTQPGP